MLGLCYFSGSLCVCKYLFSNSKKEVFIFFMCWQEVFENRLYLMQISSCSGKLISLTLPAAVCLANKGSSTAVGVTASISSQELYGSWDEGCVFSTITWFSRKPYFQWWEFDYYFSIWLISCVLTMSCFVMYVTPKEQFVWKFSNLVGTLVFTWAVLRILTQLLGKGTHFPPQCDPCQLHEILLFFFYYWESIGVEISIAN